jgi:hypothetical protein
MGQIVTKFGATKGTVVETKESLTWLELSGITRILQTNKNDMMAANDALIKTGITKITMPDGSEHTEKLEIIKQFGSLDARDAVAIIKSLTKLVNTDDPKEG